MTALPEGSALVVSLTDPAGLDPAAFGGKAATLGRLSGASVRVPRGVALNSQAYIAHVTALAGQQPADEPFRLWAAAVRERILADPVPDSVIAAVTSAANALGPSEGGWIVRSSAVGEDSASDSFAGQMDSFPDVAPAGFADAIRSVWASAWSPRAAEYRERRALTGVGDLPVGVLIQHFVEPDWAGVLFTTTPVPGSDGALVEAVQGRGEALVSGAADPVRYWLDPSGAITRVDADERGSLDESVIADLYQAGVGLATELGGPQDVEWALSGTTLYIVQSRPITTLAGGKPVDSDSFTGTVIEVTAEHANEIPPELAAKDKFKLRIIATRAEVAVSRGWLVSLRERTADAVDALSPQQISEVIGRNVERFPQVSTVLQRPPRLDGEIVRKFSQTEDLPHNLGIMIGRIGAQHADFDFIVTEIYQAEKSGISHIVDDQLVVEVAYGSYVPKGVVPTSLYVVDGAGAVQQEQSVMQENGIFIEGGQAVDRPVNAVATLTRDQLAVIRRLTSVVGAEYPDVSVEFGVLADGTPYLIDIIPDMSPVGLENVRVMSPGRLQGVARVAASEELAARSLDAHFHSERGSSGDKATSATIIIAPRPFLALENYLSEYDPGSVAFVFEQGSLLGHLAIILREHKVPAIVVPDAKELIRDGDIVLVDTASEELLSVIREQTSA